MIFLLILVNNLLIYCFVKTTLEQTSPYTLPSSSETVFQQPVSNSNSPEEEERQPPQGRRSSTHTNLTARQTERLRAIATQNFLYVATFLVSVLPTCLNILLHGGQDDPSQSLLLFPLMVLQAIFLPLQGFLNCFVYVRPSYLQTRTHFPEESRWWAFQRALHGPKVQPTDENE